MTYTTIFLVALAAYTLTRLWLNQRQRRHLRAHRDHIPSAFQQRVSTQEQQKASDYSLAKSHAARIDIALDATLLLMWTVGGGIQFISSMVNNLGLSPLFSGTMTLLLVLAGSALLSLPLSLYRTFGIEQRFGFNRSTFATWMSDLIKGALVALVIGAPLILLMLWLVEQAGSLWWLYGWLVFIGFGLFISWAFPTFIAPLFNTFTPLEDKQLGQKIDSLLNNAGFKSKGVFVIDGSRRSGHGNAYFAGLGRSKRIVFFDTLLDTLKPEQTLAVLAHELGHFHHRHILKNLLVSSLLSLIGFFLLSRLLESDAFYSQLGVSSPSTANGFLLFLLIAPIFSFFLNPLQSNLSRRYEFEADRFAATQTEATDLISALVQLYKDNANPLSTDPVHSMFYDSHPPASVRIAALQTCE